MNTATALWRLGCSVLLGAGLGLFHGFLREPGKGHPYLADAVFSLGALWVWICICFKVCRGDIRPVYLLGMVLGCLLWEKTMGSWLRPVFSGLWGFLRGIFRIIRIPWKKFLEIAKNMFASAEKWVTIKCIEFFKSVHPRRKESHGKNEYPAQASEGGSSSRVQYP